MEKEISDRGWASFLSRQEKSFDSITLLGGWQSPTSQSHCLRQDTTLDYDELSTINVGLTSRDANAITTQTTFARNDKLKGFTLAEVLITLAIIGVVTTLTISTIISDYGKKDITTKLKKISI